jgi:hypothetical protein
MCVDSASHLQVTVLNNLSSPHSVPGNRHIGHLAPRHRGEMISEAKSEQALQFDVISDNKAVGMKTDFSIRVCQQLNISWEPSQNSKHYTNKCISFSASSRSRDKTKHLQYAPQIDIPKAIEQATDEQK